MLGAPLGSWVAGADRSLPAHLQWRDAASIRPVGFGADEALLPETLRHFSGHRLLQEVSAMVKNEVRAVLELAGTLDRRVVGQGHGPGGAPTAA